MAVLNLYKDRGFHTVKIKERRGLLGKTKDLSVPFELTVEEVERLLELNSRIESLSKEKVHEEDFIRQERELKKFWDLLFTQALIILQHYQPEITIEYLKKHLTQSQALELTGFFENNRFYKAEQSASKKKDNNPLRTLRRMILFCVTNGIGLLDVKKLYIDEFVEYYNELVYTLESSGKLKEGSYDKIKGIDRTVDKLREMFNAK